MWQSRRSCLISNSSLPLWKIFCDTNRSDRLSSNLNQWRCSVIKEKKRERKVKLLPLGIVASSTLVSSGSVKSAGSCCPRQQWHHPPHSGTCDLVMIPWRSSSSPRCSFPPFAAAWAQAFTGYNDFSRLCRFLKGVEGGLPVLLQRLADVDIWHHISINKHEVRANQRLCIDIPEHIPQWAVHFRSDDVDCVRRGGSAPFGLPDGHKDRSGRSTDTWLQVCGRTYCRYSLILPAIQQQKTNVSCTPVEVRNSSV